MLKQKMHNLEKMTLAAWLRSHRRCWRRHVSLHSFLVKLVCKAGVYTRVKGLMGCPSRGIQGLPRI